MDYTKPFKYISEIACCQSISLAAEKLNIQQPALSKYLKKVENELGVELFDRSTNPITLTTAGEFYLKTAKKVIDADNQLQKQIAEIQSNSQDVRVGISPSRAPYLVPAILKEYSRKVPDANVVIIEGTTNELNTKLSHGDLDLIISLSDVDTKDFEHVKLFDELVLLAVPKGAKARSINDVFSDLNIIASGKGQLMTDLLDIMPDHVSTIECQNTITALSMVRAGIGAALVPSYMSDYGSDDGIEFRDIPSRLSSNTRREVCIFYRREQFLSTSEKIFIECAKEIVAH